MLHFKWREGHSVVSDSLRHHGLYSPWNSPGQNTGVGSLSLLQGIFPTQGSNPGLLHHRQILYQLSHKGSPRILEWVAYLFSSGSSQPRNWTGVSCIAGGFFTNWAIREHNTIHPYFLYSLAMVFHWTVLLAWLQSLLMETRKASHKFLITAIIIHSYEWLIITSSINHSCYFARYLKFFANLDGPVALLP